MLERGVFVAALVRGFEGAMQGASRLLEKDGNGDLLFLHGALKRMAVLS